MGTELRKLKPETITRALVALRAELIRDGGPGLEHVEALLQIRGHNLGPVPHKRPRQFRRGVLTRLILAELRSGPVAGRRLVEAAMAHQDGRSYRQVQNSVYTALARFQRRGLVVRESGRWRLAPTGPA